MNKSCPIKILRDLISFDSVSKKPNEEIVDYLEKIAVCLGFSVHRIDSLDQPTRSNLLCIIGPDKEGGLMLSGHMDVVPVIGQNWDSDPFCLTEKEQKLIGRGVADMKGFIAATCNALSKLSLTQLKKPLMLLWTYDEEVGCIGSAQAAPLLKNYLSYLPKAALIGEPTDFTALRMHSGHVTVRVSVKGKGAHSSNPDLGISAIKALNQSLNSLFVLEEELKQETSFKEFFKRPFVTMNIGEIHGGTAVNIVPEEAYATIGFRPLPNTSIDEVLARIIDAVTKNQRDDRIHIAVNIEKVSPAMITRAGSKLEQILLPLAKNHGPCAAQYSTDGGNLRQSGIECVIFGPGSIDVAHQANEWINKEDLTQASDKIKTIITTWFSDE
jgi:acetylornithine deacetylase